MLQELFITGLGALACSPHLHRGIVRRRRKLRSFENLLDEARGFYWHHAYLDSEVETVERCSAEEDPSPHLGREVGTGDLMEFRKGPISIP